MNNAPDWQLAYKAPDGSLELEHLDGVGWFDAPLPPRFHRCRPQTRAWTGYVDRVYRCPCGAISEDGKHWLEKNQTRKNRSRS